MDLPPSEQERVAALHRYEILDTGPEEAFDRIARLAANIFRAPYSFISFIDYGRQWFKSSHGLRVQETSSDDPACRQLIHSNGTVFIPDAASDARFTNGSWLCGDSSIRFYASAPLQVREGLPLGAIAVADVNPRKSFTNADFSILQELADAVVHELELRRAALDHRYIQEALRESESWYRSQLFQANQDLKQFAFAASHDLQEPLRGVAIHAQLLERRYREQISDPAALEILDNMIEDARRIRVLVLDLLAFTEISIPELIKMEMVDCRKALEEAMSKLRVEIEECGARFQIGALPVVRAVKAHFVQLFENLISNSIKYRSEAPSRINVSACREKHGWLVRFEDNGIGIAPEYQERIFGLFKRLHGREIPGTGMGLAICQKIIERAGGEMWVESQPGKGSTFCFTLPKHLATEPHDDVTSFVPHR